MKVFDSNGEDIAQWTGDISQGWNYQEIPAGENIAGIYGFNGYGGNGIQNFGFVTVEYY